MADETWPILDDDRTRDEEVALMQWQRREIDDLRAANALLEEQLEIERKRGDVHIAEAAQLRLQVKGLEKRVVDLYPVAELGEPYPIACPYCGVDYTTDVDGVERAHDPEECPLGDPTISGTEIVQRALCCLYERALAAEGDTDDVKAVLLEERANCTRARAAVGEAWFVGGVDLATAIRRKTQALEKTAEGWCLGVDVARVDVISRIRREARGEATTVAPSLRALADRLEEEYRCDEGTEVLGRLLAEARAEGMERGFELMYAALRQPRQLTNEELAYGQEVAARLAGEEQKP